MRKVGTENLPKSNPVKNNRKYWNKKKTRRMNVLSANTKDKDSYRTTFNITIVWIKSAFVYNLEKLSRYAKRYLWSA